MEDLTILNVSEQDVKTNEYPHRDMHGDFVFTSGQRAILIQPKFQRITPLNVQIEQKIKKAKELRREILAFDHPSDKVIIDNQKEKSMYQPDIGEERQHRKLVEAERKQYIERVMSRGYVPKQKTLPAVPAQPPVKPSWWKRNRKEIRNGIISWIAGEIFMTATQLSSLRYYRSVESILIRSLAFAVVLAIFHYTASKFKQHRKKVYAALLGFSFLMIFLMLFGPMVLYQVYPEAGSQTVANKWAIGTSTTSTVPVTHYPFLVELYRRNEWIPGMLSFLACILVFALVRKEEPAKEVKPEQPETSSTAADDEVAQRIAYYDNEILESEKREAKLMAAQQQTEKPFANKMAEMLTALKDKEQQEAGCIQERDNLITSRQLLLNEVEAEFAKYKRDYREALTNDPIKNTLINPEWETETDIIHYYKIKAQ